MEKKKNKAQKKFVKLQKVLEKEGKKFRTLGGL